MNLTNLKIISWESTKVVLIITCIVVMCANMFMVYRLADINIGQTTIYQDTHQFHQEILEKLEETKDGK